VGIGASAGGLAAFEAFFSGMPAGDDPGMAFVLVQHLAPDHKSMLAELIRRCTRMEVLDVEDGMIVHPDCAYIIPPGRDMTLEDGMLRLSEPGEPRGLRLPVDVFFRSLALDQRERAIGIVLSGTGSDGTSGVRAIKGRGGMVMVQNTESTEFSGMPGSALATGLVDYILPPAEMPAQLIAYATHAFGKLPRALSPSSPAPENGLNQVFALLRAESSHDFSLYKPSTIHRRIERRMAVHQIDSLDRYVRLLKRSKEEVRALFRDLLIGVTNFFRDPDVFELLQDLIVSKLFEGRTEGDMVRVWVPGCSTGEEAYSIAILLVEHIELLEQNFNVQVFATDIDSRAIAAARAGLYPASISADVSAERLARFFTAEADGNAYRINKSIRDRLVFSVQDVIKDPPFSKLDLISCRNLLIYMSTELQRKLIPLFHFALKPTGWLLLGTSESVGEFEGLFDVFDHKAKVYRRIEDIHGSHRTALARFLPPMTTFDREPSTPPTRVGSTSGGRSSLREVTEHALLSQVVAAGALVNQQGAILYVHGRTGMFLEPAQGEAGINNVLAMAREGLRRELTTGLRKAVSTRSTVVRPGLRVKTNGDFTLVDLTIRPVTAGVNATPEAPLFLVILEEASGAAVESSSLDDFETARADDSSTSGKTVIPPEAAEQISLLKARLSAKEEKLRSANDELENSAEELRSSNEEMQSVNEELQSTNEELETSREELQSLNEELATVNTELQSKVADLSRANNDMNNLLAGTGIGTVFVDHDLRILRFTPAVSSIINLILSDVGRPVGHIVSNLADYESLEDDVRDVLDTLVSKDVSVKTRAGTSYSMRIQPYRTQDNAIEGAVISFMDVSSFISARDDLRKANDLSRLAIVVRDSNDAITVQDLDGRILAWNPGAVRMYGWSEAEALQMRAEDRIPGEVRDRDAEYMRSLDLSMSLDPYRTRRLKSSGETVDVTMIATGLVDETGVMYAISTTERLDSGGAG